MFGNQLKYPYRKWPTYLDFQLSTQLAWERKCLDKWGSTVNIGKCYDTDIIYAEGKLDLTSFCKHMQWLNDIFLLITITIRIYKVYNSASVRVT